MLLPTILLRLRDNAARLLIAAPMCSEVFRGCPAFRFKLMRATAVQPHRLSSRTTRFAHRSGTHVPRSQKSSETGVYGSRLSRQDALGRDDALQKRERRLPLLKERLAITTRCPSATPSRHPGRRPIPPRKSSAGSPISAPSGGCRRRLSTPTAATWRNSS